MYKSELNSKITNYYNIWQGYLLIDTNESHFKLVEFDSSSSKPRSRDGAKMRISGAIHDCLRLGFFLLNNLVKKHFITISTIQLGKLN